MLGYPTGAVLAIMKPLPRETPHERACRDVVADALIGGGVGHDRGPQGWLGTRLGREIAREELPVHAERLVELAEEMDQHSQPPALILCHEEERTVGPDNVVTLEAVPLQVAKQPGRRTCAGLRVLVRRHLDGRHTVWHGPRCLGVYDGHGRRPLDLTGTPGRPCTGGLWPVARG
ncbi:MAG: hypothetical protein DMD79_12570 [Candidatus Rokuibacteriota bacterium]|nr:MAG: hypothetical protein DMD79_12570 [Candidatus Rokubacteria bacterium]